VTLLPLCPCLRLSMCGMMTLLVFLVKHLLCHRFHRLP
jgi:hypothetical protein